MRYQVRSKIYLYLSLKFILYYLSLLFIDIYNCMFDIWKKHIYVEMT